MKKTSNDRSPTTIDADHLDPGKPHDTVKGTVIQMSRRTAPTRKIFMIAPGVDTLTLLNEGCETLATVNVLIANFASKLDGQNLKVLLSIQQLAMVAEMLLNQVRDNLYPRDDVPARQPPTWH
ncbi:DUF6124 family protein [Pseudomonas fluorescens]|uniref:DUF3077 domain-containing protein n=1 Tax=Pseudomonas fluorescens TaxID=294 RepID=A0A5E7G977_PSEFL|nr:DUF6124 family protein [Pseudomonas fluorescens]VVO48016.1 hypothetical protein PS880_00150 [Pseudomonas fluorescens]